jgi:hypothetical protein
MILCGTLVVNMALMAGPSRAYALDNEQTRPSLRDLTGVYVIMEDLKPDVERDGLNSGELHSDIENRLKEAGIKVLSGRAWREEEGRPWLYVYPHVLRREFYARMVYVFSISVEFKQQVSLVRNPSVEVFATTWSKNVVGKTGFPEDIRKNILSALDDFIEAFFSVNPR